MLAKNSRSQKKKFRKSNWLLQSKKNTIKKRPTTEIQKKQAVDYRHIIQSEKHNEVKQQGVGQSGEGNRLMEWVTSPNVIKEEDTWPETMVLFINLKKVSSET